LIALTLVSLVLRIFYTGYLFQDDGLWFTAAEQLLRGKALYREIYFDKPPLLPLTYALLFKLFGAHIIVIRLFTMIFVTAVSAVLYFFGSTLYNKTTGMLAAALFTFFSTTAVSGHVQGLNTDFLMVLPYSLGAYFLTASRRPGRPEATLTLNGRQALLAIAGGALTGVAAQTNPKGMFNLAFFALLLIAELLTRGGRHESGSDTHQLRPGNAIVLLALAAGGALAASVPVVAYLAATHSLSYYFAYVWTWGFKYTGYFSLAQSLATGLRVGLNYLALNSALTIALIFFLGRMAARINHRKDQRDKGEIHDSDLVVFLWLACSSAATALGGRFYSHYFFEILPALCIAGARGLIYIGQWAGRPAFARNQRLARRCIVAALAIGFLVTVVRFHTRTAVLGTYWLRGTKSESTTRWFHEVLQREERIAAASVAEFPGGAEEAMRLAPESIRNSRQLTAETPALSSEYLFVWGYRPEVYYWSGLIPASRFISIQPVTGIPADVQYINGNARSVLPDSAKLAALDQLLKDLEETKPKYIIDEAGMFNSVLWITSYPGMAEFMLNYKQVEAAGRLMIYRRRDPLKKKRVGRFQ
jgi:hypothetical protein